jgi:F420-non-reducing hydrogenase iron-sulfur subunit
MSETFEPRIVGFLCRWCSYLGADLAGTMRLKYPPNVIPVKLNCSGRVDPEFVLNAFRKGADGVLVAGCHLGDCHYVEGNYKTLRRMTLLSRAIEGHGIDPRRLRLQWVSAAEGDVFAEVVGDFTEQIRQLGPLERLPNGIIREPAREAAEERRPEPALVG